MRFARIDPCDFVHADYETKLTARIDTPCLYDGSPRVEGGANLSR